MEERARRIVETAVQLAEEGGFEAVKLRDVASHAGVALGTLYRRFRSKEDLLIAALELETRDLERRVRQRPPKGADPRERVTSFFATATRGLVRRPHLARALLRAAACGEPELAQKVAAFHDRMEGMVVAALQGSSRGRPSSSDADDAHSVAVEPVSTNGDGVGDELCGGAVVDEQSTPGSESSSAEVEAQELAHSLTLVWFALLVGWSGGLHGQSVVVERMSSVVELLLLGAQAKRKR